MQIEADRTATSRNDNAFIVVPLQFVPDACCDHAGTINQGTGKGAGVT